MPILSGHTHYLGARAEIPTTTPTKYRYIRAILIEGYSGTLLLNRAIRDVGPNSGTVGNYTLVGNQSYSVAQRL